MGLAMKDQQGGIWVVVYCLDKKLIIYLFIYSAHCLDNR